MAGHTEQMATAGGMFSRFSANQWERKFRRQSFAAATFVRRSGEQPAAKYLLARIEFPAPIRTTPTAVNGVLFVATGDTLYALKTK